MADVSKITLPNGDTYDIKDAVARANVDHGNARIFSADCSTAAATQRKNVTIAECTELIAGDVFVITFTHAQTYNGAPTMQINSLGAKNIRRVTGSNAGRYEWNDGEVVVFKWTGTYFVITTGGTASTTYYGRTKLYSGAGSYSSALALAPISMYNMANRSICPYYSASETYAVGDKVRYNDYIYECITAITTAEAWTVAHWEIAPTLQEQVTSLNSNLNNIGNTSLTVTETPDRATILDGGAYTAGKLLVIQFTFKATASVTNSPGIANLHKSLLCDAALTAIDITSGISNAITSGVPCGVSVSGLVFIKELVKDHIYAVSGVVRCQ